MITPFFFIIYLFIFQNRQNKITFGKTTDFQLLGFFFFFFFMKIAHLLYKSNPQNHWNV